MNFLLKRDEFDGIDHGYNFDLSTSHMQITWWLMLKFIPPLSQFSASLLLALLTSLIFKILEMDK